MQRLLDRCDDAVVEDATHEAAIRLLRVVRREQVRNHDALMNDICKKTAIDTMRWRRRHRETFEPLGEGGDPSPADGAIAPLPRLEFAVIEFFRERQAGCWGLAKAYFDDRDWEHVARSIGKSHVAVRKQWSRCVALLRAAALRTHDPLFSWVRR
jgi:hypothetical protein